MNQSVLDSVQLLTLSDFPTIKNSFVNELILAETGENSSLSFIKHEIPHMPVIKDGVAQGIVIGGTNYISSIGDIRENKINHIRETKKGELPQIANRDVLFAFLNEVLDPRACAIGLNFGFPLEPIQGSKNALDGVLLHGTKEHDFKELIGKPIGRIISEFTNNRLGREIPVSVANDTVCLAISGNGQEDGSLVIGTGFNMALVSHDNTKKVIINLEAGNFDKFKASQSLTNIDNQSKNPGGQLFEKAVSGKYLVLYFNEKAKELKLPIKLLTTSQELSELSQHSKSLEGDLARAILNRSASLIATAIAGTYVFLNKPKNFTLIGEGSMLWQGWQYPEYIEKSLLMLSVPRNAITFKHIHDSSIQGAFALITGSKTPGELQ